MPHAFVRVRGAREHNLRNVNVDIPRDFVLNKVTVFAVVSALVVDVFILAEWAAGEWFANVSHTTSTIVGIAVALGLGLWMRYIHTYVDRFVDQVFFRKRRPFAFAGASDRQRDAAHQCRRNNDNRAQRP